MLSYGQTLARHLLQYTKFETGKIYTCVPENIYMVNKYEMGSVSNVSSFEQGLGKNRLRFERVTTLYGFLAQKIYETMQTEKNRICLVEDRLAKLGDAANNLTTNQIVSLNEEIYYRIKHQDSEATILDTLRKANSPGYFLCVVSKSPENLFLDSSILREQDLLNVALNIKMFAVSIYDGESFIVWENNQ